MMGSILSPGRCCCHERTALWCMRHGEPLKLREGERVMTDGELWTLRECLDPTKAAQLAQQIRACSRG